MEIAILVVCVCVCARARARTAGLRHGGDSSVSTEFTFPTQRPIQIKCELMIWQHACHSEAQNSHLEIKQFELGWHLNLLLAV
jgi:hypothetical protein